MARDEDFPIRGLNLAKQEMGIISIALDAFVGNPGALDRLSEGERLEARRLQRRFDELYRAYHKHCGVHRRVLAGLVQNFNRELDGG